MYQDTFAGEFYIERFLFHVCGATFLVFWVQVAFRRLWARIGWSVGTRAEQLVLLILVGLLTASFALLRETFDVLRGQPVLKTVLDYASWFIGAASAVWGLYRFETPRE